MSSDPEDIRVELKLTNDQVRALVHNLQSTQYFAFTFFSSRALTTLINKYYELSTYQIVLEHDQLVTSLSAAPFQAVLSFNKKELTPHRIFCSWFNMNSHMESRLKYYMFLSSNKRKQDKVSCLGTRQSRRKNALKEISLPDQVNQYRWQIDAYAKNFIKNIDITCTLVGALGIEAVAAIYSSQIAKKRKLHLTPPRKQVCDNHPIPLAPHLTPPKKQGRDNHPIPPTVTPSYN